MIKLFSPRDYQKPHKFSDDFRASKSWLIFSILEAKLNDDSESVQTPD